MRIQPDVPRLARLIGSRVGDACGRLGLGLVASGAGGGVGATNGDTASDAVGITVGLEGVTVGLQPTSAKGIARTTLAARRPPRIVFMGPIVAAFWSSG